MALLSSPAQALLRRENGICAANVKLNRNRSVAAATLVPSFQILVAWWSAGIIFRGTIRGPNSKTIAVV